MQALLWIEPYCTEMLLLKLFERAKRHSRNIAANRTWRDGV